MMVASCRSCPVALLIVMLLVGPAFLMTNYILTPAAGLDSTDIIKVGPERDYKTISSALKDGSSGSTIEVDPGTYREKIVLNDRFDLRASGEERPILEPYGPGPVIETFADGCTIEGFQIKLSQGGEEGIRLSSDGNRVANCLVSAPMNALVLNESSGNTIQNNTFLGVPLDPDDPSNPYSGSPVGYWKLDGPIWQGTSDEVKDSSGYDSHGRIRGDTLNTPGKVNNCAKFDGDGDYIPVAYNSVLNIAGPQLSMEAWVKIDDMSDHQIIVDKEESYEFMISRGNISWAIMTAQMEWYWVHTNVRVPLGVWTHIAVTYDSKNVRTYMDNVLVHNLSYPHGNVRASGLPFTIGSGYKWYSGWMYTWFTKGCIDEVKVYNVCIDYTNPPNEEGSIPSAIFLNGSDSNLFKVNTVQDFQGNGIFLRSSDGNSIIENTFLNNDKRAVVMDDGSDSNNITLNDMKSNNGGSNQAFDDGTSNLWDVSGMGNFWSDWTIPDTDNDLVVDDPYPISGDAGARDRYPLIHGNNAPKAPVILTTDQTSAYVDVLYMVKYTAEDADSIEDDLEWTMSTNAPWLSFTSLQVLRGTPSSNDTGTYWVHITVSDGSLSDSTNFTVTVAANGSGPSNELEAHRFFFSEDSPDEEIEAEDLFPGIEGVPEILVEGSDNVELSIDGSGRIKFVLSPEWSGTEVIDITASIGEWTRTVRLIINVVPVNDPPTDPNFTHEVLYYDGVQVVGFKGSSDDHDLPYGDVLTYTWYIEGIGIIGHGEQVTAQLQPGTYTITMRVMDLEGAYVDLTSEVVVESPPEITQDDVDPLPIIVIIISILTVIAVGVGVLFIISAMIRRRSTGHRDLDLSVGMDEDGHMHVPHTPVQPTIEVGEIRAGSLGEVVSASKGTFTDKMVSGTVAEGFMEDVQVEALVMSSPPDPRYIETLKLGLDGMRKDGKVSESTYRSIREELDGYN